MSLDDDLQQRAEKGRLNSGEDDISAKAYVEVFKVLQNTPDYNVPVNFADGVMNKIIAKQRIKASIFSNDYFWFGAGLVLLMALAVAAVMLTNFKIEMGFLSNMARYKGLLIFGIMFIIALNMLDKRLVKNDHKKSRGIRPFD